MSETARELERWALWCHANYVRAEVQAVLYRAADELDRARALLLRVSEAGQDMGGEVELLSEIDRFLGLPDRVVY